MEKKIGFNFLWMFSKYGDYPPQKPIPAELDFLAEEGFNFVRIPTDYMYWTKDFDYANMDERIIEYIDDYIEQCNKRGLHASLNLHRAPGYCINSPDREKHNLWVDKEAQDGFIYQWEYFAKRYAGINSELLSFDLVNEPCDRPPTHPCTRDQHQKVIRRTIKAIRDITPDREIVIDGFDGGGTALPELADAGVIHSGRGYNPFVISHFRASWVHGSDKWEIPVYPSEKLNIDMLREYYKPWKDVENMGVKVHMGECGCFNKLPNDIALRWFADLVQVFKENGWGFALWNFKGAFGIIEHGRPDTVYTDIHGLKADKAMLDIMKGAF